MEYSFVSHWSFVFIDLNAFIDAQSVKLKRDIIHHEKSHYYDTEQRKLQENTDLKYLFLDCIKGVSGFRIIYSTTLHNI